MTSKRQAIMLLAVLALLGLAIVTSDTGTEHMPPCCVDGY